MLNVCETNLSSEEAKRIRSCVLEANDVFLVEQDELGTVTDVQHRIETGDNPPVRQQLWHKHSFFGASTDGQDGE